MENAPALILTEELKQQLKQTPGVLIYNTEIRPELVERINEAMDGLMKAKAITDQASADALNATLKKAKNVISAVKAEALEARRPFNEIAGQISSSEKQALSNLTTIAQKCDLMLTQFANEQERKKDAEAQRLREEAVKAAQAETDRKNRIISLKNKFHTDALRTINNIATAEEADAKTKSLGALKFDPAIYEEYTEQMEALRPDLLERIAGRKRAITEKIEIDEKAQAEELAQIDKKAQAEASEATMSVMANAEMGLNLQTSLLEGAKSVQKRWVYKGFTDLSKVPMQYLTVNEAAVKQAIKEGHYSIPGLTIEQEISNVSR